MTNEDIITGVLAEEGRFVNNPADPGGATNWGVTNGTLSWYRGVTCTPDDVKSLTEAEARAIYLKLYILGPGFDKVQDARLRWQLVDYGVNSGPSIAIGRMQGLLKQSQDGVLGPRTLKALNEHPDPTALGNALVRERVTMLVAIAVKKQSPFWQGWLRRAMKFIAPIVVLCTTIVSCGPKAPPITIVATPHPLFSGAKYDLPEEEGDQVCTDDPTHEQVCWSAALIKSILLGLKKT